MRTPDNDNAIFSRLRFSSSRSPDTLPHMNSWPLAILFDFDGVIVNSEPLHFAGFVETLAGLGIELTEAEYFSDLIGYDDRGAFKHMLAKHGRRVSDAEFAALLLAKSDATAELIRSGQFDALPGVRQLIPLLASRYPLAICSGALRHEIESMLDAIGLRSQFPVIVSAEDVTVGKPDPRCYVQTVKRVADRTGRTLTPADCLVIEDAPSVIHTVKRAGFQTLGVAGSYPIESLAEADYRVMSLKADDVRAAIPALIF